MVIKRLNALKVEEVQMGNELDSILIDLHKLFSSLFQWMCRRLGTNDSVILVGFSISLFYKNR